MSLEVTANTRLFESLGCQDSGLKERSCTEAGFEGLDSGVLWLQIGCVTCTKRRIMKQQCATAAFWSVLKFSLMKVPEKINSESAKSRISGNLAGGT